MTIFLQFFRLSASFCPGAACPAVGPQAAQIPRQVGIAAPDMSGIQHPHAAPVPHTKARPAVPPDDEMVRRIADMLEKQ